MCPRILKGLNLRVFRDVANLIWKFIFLQRLEETRYDVMWADKENYVKIIIHPGMLSDHMPDRVMKALGRIFIHDQSVQEV